MYFYVFMLSSPFVQVLLVFKGSYLDVIMCWVRVVSLTCSSEFIPWRLSSHVQPLAVTSKHVPLNTSDRIEIDF